MYDLPKDILSTLIPKDEAIQGPDDGASESTDARSETSESTSGSAAGSKACSLCGVSFETVEEQRSHTRSDLHGYNLKRKIRGLNSVTENEFEKLVGGQYIYV